MKKLLWGLIICTLCNFSVASAQQQRIDSLKSKLQYQQIVNFIDSLQTDDEKLLLQKVEALRKIGNMTDAIHALQNLCKQTKKVELFRELANYYDKVGNRKQALETLQNALAIEQNNQLYYDIAKLQYNLREFEAGNKSCNIVLQKDSIPSVLHLQSRFYQALEKLDSAVFVLQRAIAHNSKDYIAVVGLANYYKKEGDYKTIISLTDAYLQEDATNVNVLSLNAYAYFSLHKYRKAKELYEKLFELGNAPPQQYFYLGYSYYRLGQANDAYNTLLKANELAQGLNEAILYHLGLAALKSLRYEEGIEFLEKALHYYLPDNDQIKEIYRQEAHAYHKLGQNRKAIAMLRKGQKYKYTYRTLFDIGLYYEKNKENKRAIKAYRKFLKALPDSLKSKGLKNLKKYVDRHLQDLEGEEFMKRVPTKKP